MHDILGFIIWISLTIIIEVSIALIFRYRNKKQLACIAITNLVTMIPLSILLYAEMMDIRQRPTGDGGPGYGMGLIVVFVVGGILACLIKIVVYIIWLNALSKQPEKRGWGRVITLVYALTANAVSFAAGIELIEMNILL